MSSKTYSMNEIEELFTTSLDEAHAVNTFSRSVRLQKIQIESLNKTILLFKGFKSQAILVKNEAVANEFFRMQCMLSSLRASLECWVFIKDAEFNKAWCKLIDAQEYCAIATKIEKFEGLDNLHSHLKAMEKAIFPGWAVYNSVGFLETIGKCSICNSHFNDCEHLEGEIYMARLCRRIDRDIIEFNHSSIVTAPHDRRCIITHLTEKGVTVDNFTREPTGEINEDKEGYYFKGILFNLKPLDLD